MKKMMQCLSMAVVTGCLVFTGSELSAQSKKKSKDLEKAVESNAEKIVKATEDLEKLAELLAAGECDAKPEEFKRYGSARQLYNFNIDNAY